MRLRTGTGRNQAAYGAAESRSAFEDDSEPYAWTSAGREIIESAARLLR